MKKGVVILVIVAAVIAAAVWWTGSGRARPTAAPVPTVDLAHADPLVKALVERTVDETKAAAAEGDAWAHLAMVYHANGWLDPAITCYREAIRRDENQASWWYLMALAQHELGDAAAADASIDRSIALDAAYAPAHWRRGDWQLDAGSAAMAEESYRQTLAIDRSALAGTVGLARVALATGRNDEALAIIASLVKAFENVETEPPPYLYFLLGTAQTRTGQRAGASAALARGLAARPEWPDLWLDEVRALRTGLSTAMAEADRMLGSGRARDAVEHLEALRATYPGDVQVESKLVEAMLAAGDVDRGMRLARDLADAHPDQFAVQLTLGYACELAGEAQRALEATNAAIELNPRLGAAWYQKARILIAAKNYEGAIEPLDRAIEFGFNGAIAHLTRGQVLMALQRWDDALGALAVAANLDPNNPAAHGGVAIAAARVGRLDVAVQALERGRRLDPENPFVKQAATMLQVPTP
ncbi:MAG: tetratricopeptide repeat protein [Phycisphaerales bacterium]|nr:tetratricopeptide repeat protein [Phycisphaerales bacterium]